MGYKAKNFAFTHLAGSLAADSLTMSVGTGTGSRFPTLGDGDYTLVVVESAEYREVVKVTAISGDTFTIPAGGRGFEGSTPRAWGVGAVVRCCVTAGVVQEALMLAEMLSDHTEALDPHPQYLTALEANAAYLPLTAVSPYMAPVIAAGDAAALRAAGVQPGNSNLDQVVLNGARLRGLETVWVPATAMYPTTSKGAVPGTVETTTNKIMLKTMDFDPAIEKYAQFGIRMPKSWDKGGVTAQFVWSNPSGTGAVVWALSAVAISDDDVLDAAFGTVVPVTDTVTAAGDLMHSAVTAALTVGGTPVEGDFVVFQVQRTSADAADTLAANARLHGVVVFYTVNSANDA